MMNGAEIITYIQNNMSTLITPVTTIAGALMTALFLRKRTSTETLTQEFEKIKAGHLKEAADALLESGKMTYTEYYKMNNFLTIAKRADEMYKDMTDKENSEPYNFDWFMRFYEDTGTISDADIQELWAKILAGEILQPGSYSLRALETLKNLSKAEAVLFQKICTHSIIIDNKVFLPHYDDYMKCADISFDEILKLSDCGLINGDSFLVLQIPLGADLQIILNNEHFVMTAQATQGTENKVLAIKQFPFTVIGRELSRLMDMSTSDDDVLQFGKCLKNGNEKKFIFSINRIVYIKRSEIRFERDNLLDDLT